MVRPSLLRNLPDERWALIELAVLAAKPGERSHDVDMREVISAMLYQNRRGCEWDMLPDDLPPKSTVHEYLAAWRDDGTTERIRRVLREACRHVHAPSEEPTTSAASIDSQTAKKREQGDERGYDGGKKIKRRKRHIVADSLKLLLAVVVTSAGVDGAIAIPQPFAQPHSQFCPHLQLV